MEELLKENLVEQTENVEQTTEQIEEVVQEPQKIYTEEEFNKKLDEVLGKKIARNTAKIRKEYERKYGELENVLKAGTGKDNVAEMTDTFREFYESKGIKISKEPQYSDKDIEVLARAEANEIINSGLEDVIEEVDRLADIGLGNMSAREKAVFKTLAEYRQNAEQTRDLARIGVKDDVLNDADFKQFAGQFNKSTPITTIYEIYQKTQPKKQIQTMGSMKSNAVQDTGIKEFYTVEEARQFTKADFDKNPELFKAVERSMTKWK